jgi:hypothetical protein
MMWERMKRGRLMKQDDDPGASGSFTREEVSQIVNNEINKAMAAFVRKEMPKILSQQMETMSDQFMERLARELPSDEEIEMLEQGIDPETGQPMYESEQIEEQPQPQQQQPRAAGDPRTNAEIYKLSKANNELSQRLAQIEQEREEANTRAETSDRAATVQGALNKYQWANDDSREMALSYVGSKVQRAEDGSLVAGDLPLAQFVEQYLGRVPNMLAPRQIGGSGASSGNGRSKPLSMEDITPDMAPEKRQEIMSFAVNALKSPD